MTKDIKIVTVLGTRPEIIRLSQILKRFNENFDSIIINTNQNSDFNLNKNIINDLKINGKIINLEKKKSSNSFQKTLQIISETYEILNRINPDIFFVLGDTNSALTSLAAKNLKIPVFHFEAGNRCFNQNVPEEINRKLVDCISDINITYSSISRDYLLRENTPPEQVIKVGSPLLEVYRALSPKINKSKVLNKYKLKKKGYFLISFHRSENIDDPKNLKMILRILENLNKDFKEKLIISTHPRTRSKISNFISDINDNKIIFSDPLNYTDYMKAQKDSKFVLSDSGSISEEASILNINAIQLRNEHERPEAMEEATTILSSLDYRVIFNVLKNNSNYKRKIKSVKDYSDDNISYKILNIVYSHYQFVNKKVWKKDQ